MSLQDAFTNLYATTLLQLHPSVPSGSLSSTLRKDSKLLTNSEKATYINDEALVNNSNGGYDPMESKIEDVIVTKKRHGSELVNTTITKRTRSRPRLRSRERQKD